MVNFKEFVLYFRKSGKNYKKSLLIPYFESSYGEKSPLSLDIQCLNKSTS